MTEEKDENTTELVCGVLLLFGMPMLIAWGAYVDAKLWLWFAVPLGLPTLSIAHMAGLGVLIRSLTSQVKRKSPKAVTALAHSIASPAIYLLVGWLIHHFFMVAQ
jgi:hypothetical protein